MAMSLPELLAAAPPGEVPVAGVEEEDELLEASADGGEG
jgi:hypothetical protein